MMIDRDDPRLTSYALGECSPEEKAMIEQALKQQPSLRQALEEIEAGKQQLRSEFVPHAPPLLRTQRDRIFQNARGSKTRKSKVSGRRWVPVVLVAGLLFGVAFALLKTPAKSLGKPKPSSPTDIGSTAPPKLSRKAAVLPFPGPPVPAEATERNFELSETVKLRNEILQAHPLEYPRLVTEALGPEFDIHTLPPTTLRETVSTSVESHLQLPIVVGNSSLGWISNSVLNKEELPPAKAVRLEELINAFTLTPTGASAISRGVSLSAETFACPWKPSSTLLMIRIQGAIDGPREVIATLEVDPTAVLSFRLLGFAPVKGLENEASLHTLPAKTGTTLLLELESRSPQNSLGSIAWKIDGTEAAALPIVRIPEAEPSNDACFAALLATWSMWLRGEGSAVVDAEFVGGLGRECASVDLPENRKEALVLIAKSLELVSESESD